MKNNCAEIIASFGFVYLVKVDGLYFAIHVFNTDVFDLANWKVYSARYQGSIKKENEDIHYRSAYLADYEFEFREYFGENVSNATVYIKKNNEVLFSFVHDYHTISNLWMEVENV